MGPGFHLLLALLGEYLLGTFWEASLVIERLQHKRKLALFREEGVGLVWWCREKGVSCPTLVLPQAHKHRQLFMETVSPTIHL